MEDWSKDFIEILDTVALMVDEFFLGFTEAVEVVADQVQNSMATEIDQIDLWFQELFEPFAEIYLELEELEVDPSINYPVEPTPEKHPACIGCHHYHGQVYGGNLLVCAMHPYGWDDKNCPDWQEWEESSKFDDVF